MHELDAARRVKKARQAGLFLSVFPYSREGARVQGFGTSVMFCTTLELDRFTPKVAVWKPVADALPVYWPATEATGANVTGKGVA
jgi:hypothetical protein